MIIENVLIKQMQDSVEAISTLANQHIIKLEKRNEKYVMELVVAEAHLPLAQLN